MPPKVRVVWLIDARFEREWLMTLLSKPGAWEIEEIEADPTPLQQPQTLAHAKLYPPGTLFIFNRSIMYERYFARYEEAGIPFAAVHLSDEFYSDTYNFYEHRMCMWVARNYWHPKLAEMPKVFTFGLGWKNGFKSVQTAAEPPPEWKDRPYSVSFAGNIHHTMRRDFVAAFEDVPGHYFHLTFDGFNSASGLKLAEYRDMMNKSKYVLCPIGHFNVDCFRVYEALEAGAVPIAIMWTSAQRWQYWNTLFEVGERGIPWIQAGAPNGCRYEYEKMLHNTDAEQAAANATRQLWDATKAKWTGYFHKGIQRLLDLYVVA